LCPRDEESKAFEGVWKYNLPTHLKLVHPSSKPSSDLIKQMKITREEEEYLKVPHVAFEELFVNTEGEGREP
jgi:hypothetical protein